MNMIKIKQVADVMENNVLRELKKCIEFYLNNMFSKNVKTTK